VAKRDGRVRICVEFRALIAVKEMDDYPIRRMDRALAVLQGAKVSKMFDL
jgi:hypothetical protein